MAPQGPTASKPPVTNRGVELAEATFCGAKMSDRVTHDSGLSDPAKRR